MGAEGDLVNERMARGCRCFAVWIEAALGGYGWLSARPEWIGELQLEITPRPGEAYVWNCATVPEHRQRGVFRSLLIGISRLAHAEGIRRLWIGSIAIPAERAVGPSGFQPALRFTTLKLGGLHVLRITEAGGLLSREAEAVLAVRPGWRFRRSSHRRH